MRSLTDDRYVRYYVTLDENEHALDLRRADSFKGGFEQYVREKVAAFEKKPYVPGWIIEEFSVDKPVDAMTRHSDDPSVYYERLAGGMDKTYSGRYIKLEDAVYAVRTGRSIFSPEVSYSALARDKRYKEFLQFNRQQRWRYPDYDTARKVYGVATDGGVLLFSDTLKGRKARTTYLQSLADRYFELPGRTVRLCELTDPPQSVTEQADRCIVKLDKRDLKDTTPCFKRSEVDFSAERMAEPQVLGTAVCTGRYELQPDYLSFERFVKENKLEVSARNYDIASLTYIRENGYADHVSSDYFYPFSYQYRFDEVAAKLGDVLRARREHPGSEHDFGYAVLQREAKQIAAGVLRDEFRIGLTRQAGEKLTDAAELSLPAKTQSVMRLPVSSKSPVVH